MLIDDYRGEGSYAFLLRLLDRYPMQLPVKGGFVVLQAVRIYITSNVAPPWGTVDTPEALLRRIRKTVELRWPIDFERDNGDAIWSQLTE